MFCPTSYRSFAYNFVPEYITQLEAEIANKVTENGDLRAQNRALVDENKRLTDLTRMLLGSPSFSDFLERLSSNPAPGPQPNPPMEQPQVARQMPKDVNPYTAQQHMHRQSVGVAMIPEQSLEFSVMSADADAYNFQPQVFAVLETPEPPLNIDTVALSGKASNFVPGSFESADEKVDIPVIEQIPTFENVTAPMAPEAPVTVDEEFENNPEFALYHEQPLTGSTPIMERTQIGTDSFEVEIFGGVESEKLWARLELVDAPTQEQNAAIALASFQRRMSILDAACARLEVLTAEI